MSYQQHAFTLARAAFERGKYVLTRALCPPPVYFQTMSHSLHQPLGDVR